MLEVIVVFYDRFEELCRAKGVKPQRACIEMGLSRSIAAKWKNTGTKPSADVLPKIADYFNVSIEFLLSGEQTQTAPTLTQKDERDIAKDLERIMDSMENGGDLMFDGKPLSSEAKESLAAAMKLGLEAAKLKNKERFTPKKYRGR